MLWRAWAKWAQRCVRGQCAAPQRDSQHKAGAARRGRSRRLLKACGACGAISYALHSAALKALLRRPPSRHPSLLPSGGSLLPLLPSCSCSRLALPFALALQTPALAYVPSLGPFLAALRGRLGGALLPFTSRDISPTPSTSASHPFLPPPPNPPKPPASFSAWATACAAYAACPGASSRGPPRPLHCSPLAVRRCFRTF